MRVLLVNQFYAPDVAPTGQYLHDLARQLVARGHDVTVLCSRRSYDRSLLLPPRDTVDGVTVLREGALGPGRGPGRVLDALWFHLALFRTGRRLATFDATVCLTSPPFVGWTVGRALGARAGAQVSWVMDVYPDVLAAHGLLREGGMAFRTLETPSRQQIHGAALVLALGARMEDRLAPRVREPTRLESVPLWARVSPPAAAAARRARADLGWPADDCVFLYSGNMGLGHRLDEFLEVAASEPRQPEAGKPLQRPFWVFAGGGRRRPEVAAAVRAHSRAPVRLLPYAPQEELPARLAAADVHLVSQRSEWEGLIVPSKLQAAFSVGRPVLFVGGPDSEVGEWVARSGGGWVVPEGDVEGLRAAVGEALEPEERGRRGRAARDFARAHFDRESSTTRIEELIEECVRRGTRG